MWNFAQWSISISVKKGRVVCFWKNLNAESKVFTRFFDPRGVTIFEPISLINDYIWLLGFVERIWRTWETFQGKSNSQIFWRTYKFQQFAFKNVWFFKAQFFLGSLWKFNWKFADCKDNSADDLYLRQTSEKTLAEFCILGTRDKNYL